MKKSWFLAESDICFYKELIFLTFLESQILINYLMYSHAEYEFSKRLEGGDFLRKQWLTLKWEIFKSHFNIKSQNNF